MTGSYLLHDYVLETALRLPEKPALIGSDARLTYAELEGRSNALAHALIARGVSRGDRVLVIAKNSPDVVLAFIGAHKANAVAVLINPVTKPEKLAYLVSDCRPSVVVCDVDRLDDVEQVLAQAHSTAHVLTTGASSGAAERQVETESMDAALASAPRTAAPSRSNIDVDFAAIIYTSGSTGDPKGVMMSHRNMRAAASSIVSYLGLKESDVILNALPLSFDYGLYQVVMACLVGATVLLEQSFTFPADVLRRAVAAEVTVFPGVPSMFSLVGSLARRGTLSLPGVQMVTNTGAALLPGHIAAIKAVFANARIVSMYGLTECKRCTYLPPEDLDRKPGSVGIAIPNTELWIVDDRGEKVAAGEVGQLVIRGATVMRGYGEKPKETQRRLRPGPVPGEQVLYTGDLCRQDADGYLYFVARTDDIIKSRGEKVAPAEVERIIAAIPWREECRGPRRTRRGARRNSQGAGAARGRSRTLGTARLGRVRAPARARDGATHRDVRRRVSHDPLWEDRCGTTPRNARDAMSRSNDPGAPAEAPEDRANLEQVRVVPFVAGHLSAVERFSERVWSRPRTQAFLEWRYLASLPFGSSFVALAEATCVGVVAGLQKTHVIGGQSVPCLEVFDWHALPEAQGSGVGVRLMKAMMRLGVRLLSVGGSDDAVNAFPLLGWEPLGHAKEFVLPLSGGYLESRLNSKLGVRLPGQEAALSAVAATWFRPRPKRLLGWVLEATTLDPAIADLYTGDTGYDWLQRPTLAVPRWLSQSTWTGAYRCWLFGTGEGEPARGWVLGRVYDTVDGREASILDVYARDVDADLYAWMGIGGGGTVGDRGAAGHSRTGDVSSTSGCVPRQPVPADGNSCGAHLAQSSAGNRPAAHHAQSRRCADAPLSRGWTDDVDLLIAR